MTDMTPEPGEPAAGLTTEGRWVEFGWSGIPIANLPLIEIEGLTHPKDAQLLAQFCDYLATDRTLAGGQLAGALFRGVARALNQWARTTEASNYVQSRAFGSALDNLQIPLLDQPDTDAQPDTDPDIEPNHDTD